MMLVVGVPTQPSSILRLTLPAAASLMAPELTVARLVYEFTPISRPAVMLMPAALSAKPLWVACTLPLRRMSLLAPLALMVTRPLLAVMVPRPIEAAPVTVMEVPAFRLPTPTPVLLVRLTAPLVAVKSLPVMLEPASTRFCAAVMP